MNDDALDARFAQLVQRSWKRYEETWHNSRIDDLLLGGIISALVEDNLALIDLSSDGKFHYLQFEDFATKERLIVRLTHLTEALVDAKVLGRHAEVVIGVGKRTNDTATLWQTLKQEVKSAFLDTGEPGTITLDAEMTSGYIYAQVPLLLDLDPYFSGPFQVDYAKLRDDLAATRNALRKYLHGRIGS